jgi:hypothetical protein
MNGKTMMHKAKALWGRMGSGETRYKTWRGGGYDVYWYDDGGLAESCRGDQMTQFMAKGKTVTL